MPFALVGILMMVVAVAAPIAITIGNDIFRPYTDIPDADLIYLGQALRISDGLPQTYFDHPAYNYHLILLAWLKALALVGLVPDPSLAGAIAAPDIDSYMQPLVIAGRALSALMGALFVGLTIAGLRGMGVDFLPAAGGGLLLGLSSGIAIQSMILRAELPSAIFAFCAFLALGVAARADRWRQLAWLFVAGFAAMSALQAKVQAIIPLVGLIVAAVAIEREPRPVWPAEPVSLRNAFVLFALAACVPFVAMVILAASFRDFSYAHLNAANMVKNYHAVILLMGVISIAIYGKMNRVPPGQLFAGATTVLLGISVAGYALFLKHDVTNLDVIVFSVEHMRVFSQQIARHDLLAAALKGINSLWSARAGKILSPIYVIEFFAIASSLFLFIKGAHKRAALIALVAGVGFVTEALFDLRGYRPTYRIYVEPWMIGAAALGADKVLNLANNKTQPKSILTAAVLVMAAWSMVAHGRQPLAPQPISDVCGQVRNYVDPTLAKKFHRYCPDGAGAQSSMNKGRSSAT